MSYLLNINVAPSLVSAALALDTVDACKNHKLKPDAAAKKHTMLAQVMQDATQRFMALATGQTVVSKEEFFKQAFERLQVIKAERKELMLYRRARREQDQADTLAMQQAYPDTATA